MCLIPYPIFLLSSLPSVLRYFAPNAAAGYDLSLFFLTVELLLELAPDTVPLPFPLFGGPNKPGAMSAGKSFHSVSGRWFWKDPLC